MEEEEEENEYTTDSIGFPMPPQQANKKQFWREVDITIYQVIHVIASTFLDLLEIRITLNRLNPPRLLISQSIQYFSMLLAYFFRAFVNSYARKKSENEDGQFQKLSAISAVTLTLLDISCDASAKIALLLSPREKIESFFGLLPLLQTLISFFVFIHPTSYLSIIAVFVQTVGYLFVSSNGVGKQYEPTQQDKYQVFGLTARTAGYVFATISLFLRCINLTMTQIMATSVRFTASSFCQGTGSWGLIITSAYHFFIYKNHKEKIVLLTPATKVYRTLGLFIGVAALKHYTGFWLVLHTSAVEYTRVVMCSNLMMFAVRHVVFREDGAAFGYSQIPVAGLVIMFIGFALLCIAPPSMNDRELLINN
ncbi:hypothetical protein TRFO_39996 [Tritrichomonas foetus]|uniref:Uncharacterized protein n=1 Tax=Tritrichomonas foetus TaxID=1144522 RepID=A0A1J4J6C7_9EUKA|nr:hypothetical protein TRFO_39996 [Tritrichomonas foetus]|eukprot:OHS93711.1 hypothetical protein TRFO_39996 [Tritrichomonas foetus]